MQTDIRDAAHKLIDHLPTQATWDDLIYDVIAVMHIRQLLPDDLNRLR
ncbi:hypothetical protein [Lamprocystis purpurea]|nr:hypothetical protein [Lamprocystis purpurea]